MRRIGDVELKLAKGPVPHYKEIKEFTRSILKLLEYEFGTKEIINRFSNPLWFNSYACLVGFEWNYSGMTTVTLKAVKEISKEENIGIYAFGGKGREIKVTEELEKNEDLKNLDYLKKASILSSKVDNNLVQDGYSLYFHFMICDEEGNYTIINQKMSIDEQKVRRFHWINTKDFLNDPQIGFGIKTKTLNISSKEMENTRKDIVSLLNEKNESEIKNYIIRLQSIGNKTILDYLEKNSKKIFYQELPEYLKIPKKIYWKALKINKTIEKFEDILFLKGFGPGLIRSLVYVANIIYGSEISWRDPIIYTFAHGTKAGKPYYVKKALMLEEAEIIKNAIEEAKVGEKWKLRTLKKLSEIIKLNEV
ncbi:MAG: DUF763 domain-containing protein [Nanopusillaceae archaeon]